MLMIGPSLYDNFLRCRDEMVSRFTLSELRQLCLDVGTAADRLDTGTLDELAAALLHWADARGGDTRAALLGRLRALLPNVPWPSDYTTQAGGRSYLVTELQHVLFLSLIHISEPTRPY